MAKSKKQQPVKDDVDDFLKKVGEKLKKIRKENGYQNYIHFAIDNNMSHSQYGRYENGEDMRLSSLHKVLKAHKTNFKEFFKDFD